MAKIDVDKFAAEGALKHENTVACQLLIPGTATNVDTYHVHEKVQQVRLVVDEVAADATKVVQLGDYARDHDGNLWFGPFHMAPYPGL